MTEVPCPHEPHDETLPSSSPRTLSRSAVFHLSTRHNSLSIKREGSVKHARGVSFQIPHARKAGVLPHSQLILRKAVRSEKLLVMWISHN